MAMVLLMQGLSFAASAAEPRARSLARKPAMKIETEGALGYSWSDWRWLAAAKDTHLRWRFTAGAATSPNAAGTDRNASRIPADLFANGPYRTRWWISDVPLRHDGVLTLDVRWEF